MAVTRERVLGELRRRPRSARELLDRLGGGRQAKRELHRLLRDLVRSGEVDKRDRRYRLPRADGLLEGVFHPGPGAGGTVVSDGGRVFEVRSPGGAEVGDRVLFVPFGDGPDGDVEVGRAEILDVLDRKLEEWIGIVHLELAGAVVTPYRDDEEWGIAVPRKHLGRARDGDVVVVVPAPRQPRSGPLAGRVTEVLGRPGEPEPDFRAVVWHRRLPVEFPLDVLEEAERLPDEPDPADLAGREDLRDLPFVTIDPATARDHDDAVWVEARGGGFRLFVAIADVSHYVREGGALDREALRRGNSVYFPDRAIPMLPERLSSDLCSLRAGVDRPALVARLDVDGEGNVQDAHFSRALLRCRAGLAYEDAAAVMAGDAAAIDRLPDPALAPALERLAELARRLLRRREAGGSIDLDLPEARIELDAHGMPVRITQAERTWAHRAIEEAMLVANRAVARHLLGREIPGIFRVHEPPAPGDAEELRGLLESFGLVSGRSRGEGLTAAEVAGAVQRVAGRPEARLVNLMTLRAMQQAHYEPANKGHFALAFDAYLHFTSPIRRYADLVVHRALVDVLAGGARLESARARGDGLAAVSTRISWRERVALSAERDMADLKKCAFMQQHLGQEFDGTVTSVARQGLYVTLDRFFVDGLVHVSTLPEWVELDEARHALVAPATGRQYHLGDRFRVCVDQVDPVKGWINFSIVEAIPERGAPSAERGAPSARAGGEDR